MVRKSKFAGKTAERIKKIKENVNSLIHLEEDVYEALCIGVTYWEDVISSFEGEEKVQDKIDYIFLIPTEDGDVHIKGEYTVSAYEKAKLPKILAKFDIDLEEWYNLLGENLRLSIGEKTSAKGKEYNFIVDILKPKKSQKDIEYDKIELPYWFSEDVEEDMIELLDNVSIKAPEKKKKRKPRASVVEDEVVEEDDVIEEEIVEDDDFFDDLEQDDDE